MTETPPDESGSSMACDCETCVGMCWSHPCSGTPADMEALMDAGYADRLALDEFAINRGSPIPWLADWQTVAAVLPGVKGSEGDVNPGCGECTFLQEDDRCELHALGLKPTAGRRASCHEPFDHTALIVGWDTPDGRRVVERLRSMIRARRNGTDRQ